MRPLALRGPLVVCGWGYDTALSLRNGSGYQRFDTWPTGPVDLLWDDYRKVWTAHDFYVGVMQPNSGSNALNIAPGGTGAFTVWDGRNPIPLNLTVYNWYSNYVIASGSSIKATVGYVAPAHRYYLMGIDCT
jgi:hypothetical protein